MIVQGWYGVDRKWAIFLIRYPGLSIYKFKRVNLIQFVICATVDRGSEEQ